jgi:hypothetical protein
LQGFFAAHGFIAAHGFAAAQGLTAAQGLAAAAQGLQLVALGAHGLQAAAQGLQLATRTLSAAAGSAGVAKIELLPYVLAAAGLARVPCATEPASRSETAAAARPLVPIVSPKATGQMAAVETSECFIDFIVSSVYWAPEPPAAISGPEAVRHLSEPMAR